ncbi:hypothetical protein BKA61DRAFT_666173 [Leptodontidium sp. MPI-SDFR-AT-0119]|nr:hypothetical protein BKA61DRAFT_666173 [Leptodontidium sp. MPI-SDFR-AT-0119]
MQFRQIVVLATWFAVASAIRIAAPDPEPIPYCITVGQKRGHRRAPESVEKRSPMRGSGSKRSPEAEAGPELY